jgi:rfaE bifunctional protein kinase chain/domain
MKWSYYDEKKGVHNPKVLIVGDLMIDEWVYGEVNRLSPEAPIPIVDIETKRRYLGGAGNVYQNIKAIGGEPIIIGGTSNTVDGRWIENMLDDRWTFDIPKTFVKTRICSGQQQIVRLDVGKGRKITDIEIEKALDQFDDEHIDIVIVADYGKGAVTETMLYYLSKFCIERKIKMLIDPYKGDHYYNQDYICELVKLNKKEAEYFSGLKVTKESLPDVGRILFDKFSTYQILVTLGYEGMAYFNRSKYKKNPCHIMDKPEHIYDVCGAGDVVIAVLAYMMCYEPWEDDMEKILIYAARAGKIAVSKKETSVVTYKELFEGDL